MLQQRLQNLHVIKARLRLLRRYLHRVQAAGVGVKSIRLLIKEKLNRVDSSPVRRTEQRGVPGPILLVDVCSILDQAPDCLRRQHQGCKHQRRPMSIAADNAQVDSLLGALPRRPQQCQNHLISSPFRG